MWIFVYNVIFNRKLIIFDKLSYIILFYLVNNNNLIIKKPWNSNFRLDWKHSVTFVMHLIGD